MLARKLRRSHVVSAFNTVPSEVFSLVFSNNRKKSRRPSLVYCGDNVKAKNTGAKLIRDTDFDPIDAGPLSIHRTASRSSLPSLPTEEMAVGNLLTGSSTSPSGYPICVAKFWIKTNSRRHKTRRSGSQPSGRGRSIGSPARFALTRLLPRPIRRACKAPVSHSSPGARTAWHTHPLGQTLIVTSGCGNRAGAGPSKKYGLATSSGCPAKGCTTAPRQRQP